MIPDELDIHRAPITGEELMRCGRHAGCQAGAIASGPHV